VGIVLGYKQILELRNAIFQMYSIGSVRFFGIESLPEKCLKACYSDAEITNILLIKRTTHKWTYLLVVCQSHSHAQKRTSCSQMVKRYTGMKIIFLVCCVNIKVAKDDFQR